MDCSKVGKLLYTLRTEQNMTQKQVADALNLSDKTVSKWERGLGCPDVSLLGELSELFSVNIEKLLAGELAPNDTDGGNMKKIKFYVCPDCGNVITSTGGADVSCCGRKLNAMLPQAEDPQHNITVETVEEDYYITFSHPMTKEHYISFVACASYDRVMLVKLYPEQGGEVRFPKIHSAKLYFGCNRHGLWLHE